MMKANHQDPKEMKTLFQLLSISERHQTDRCNTRNLSMEVLLFAVLLTIAFLPMSHGAQVIGGLIQTVLLFFDRAKARG
jgi:hypothetical protein